MPNPTKKQLEEEIAALKAAQQQAPDPAPQVETQVVRDAPQPQTDNGHSQPSNTSQRPSTAGFTVGDTPNPQLKTPSQQAADAETPQKDTPQIEGICDDCETPLVRTDRLCPGCKKTLYWSRGYRS